MPKKYVPPVQKGFGQLVDSLFLLVLVYLSLLAPLLMNTPETQPATDQTKAPVTWQELKQDPTMQAQWQKLGYDPEKAKAIIASKFDYTIQAGSLLLTISVMIGYFVFMLWMSDKQYREVIAERFDKT